MFNYSIKAGTVDVSVVIRIIDSADGTPETGVVFNTAGIDLEYRRELAASTDITEATLAALTTAHSDGGFLHIGNGYYRLDLPDAACATGSAGVLVHGVVTGMVVIGCYIQLVAYDPFDTVRLGLTALPNAAAAAAGGLFTRGTGAGQINQDANGRIDVNVAAISTDSVAADNLESYTDGTTPMPVNATQISGDSVAADNAEAFFDGTGYAGTNNVIPTVTTVNGLGANVITAASMAADASAEIADAVWDEPLSVSVHATSGTAGYNMQIAGQIIVDTTATGAPSSTAIQLTAGSAVDDFYNDQLLYIADGTGIGQVRVILDYVGATKTVTVSEAYATTPASGDRLVIQTAHVHTVQAIQSGLATSAALTTVEGKIDTIDTNVDAILVDTAEIGAAGAGLTALASAANLATLTAFVDTEVASILSAVDTEVAAILADTNELQTDWVNGGRLDLILDARASQTSVDDLPTNAELATALGTADDAVLAALATVDGNVDTILVTTNRLETTFENTSDGVRFTADSLELAPTGGTAPTVSQIADEVQTRTIAAVTTVNGLAANVITAAATAADFTTEIQTGLATSAALATVDTVVDAIKVTTDRLETTFENTSDGVRFTADALELAPTGGSAPTVGQIADEVQTRTIAAVTTVNGLAANVITAAATAADFTTEIQSGLSTLDAAGVRTAVGLASANLDTQLAAIDDAVDTEVAAIKAVTDKLDNTLENTSDGWIFTVNGLQNAPSGSGSTPSAIADEVQTRTIAAVTMVNGLAANTVNASALAADAVAEIQSGLSTLDAAGIRTAVGLASANLDTQLDALPTAVENADTLLNRDMSTGTDSGSTTVRTPRQALRILRNKWSIDSDGLQTMTKEDDVTPSWTQQLSTDAAAVPVTGTDPAGP